MGKQRKGKSLEALVAAIENALKESPNVSVYSPMRLRDRTNGRLREHDVVLEWKHGHHVLQVAIECRDRSRPIGVEQVESFHTKCQHTGVSQGIIVSPRGFYETARKTANFLGIRCIDLRAVEGFDWLLAAGIWIHSRNLLHSEWLFRPVEDGVIEDKDFDIIDTEGNLATTESLNSNLVRAMEGLVPMSEGAIESEEVTVRFPGEGLFLRHRVTGKTVAVNFAVAKARYSVTHEFVPFTSLKYGEQGTPSADIDVAYADLAVGDSRSRLLITFREGEGGAVSLAPIGPKDEG